MGVLESPKKGHKLCGEKRVDSELMSLSKTRILVDFQMGWKPLGS